MHQKADESLSHGRSSPTLSGSPLISSIQPVGGAHGYSICPLRGQEHLVFFHSANSALVLGLLNNLLRNLSRHRIVMRELHVE